MKNFLSKIVVWCNTHIWQSVLIGVATVGVVATAIAVPIALSDKSHEHTFGEWQIVTPATCTVDGVEERSCSCGETETKKIDATGHTYSTEWTTDDTYHWHVATCCETEEVSNKSEHEWGEWSVKTPATCTQDGLRERECSICHDKESEKINSTGHTYSQDWTSDDTHHWHEATCEHTDEVSEKEEHDFLPFGLCKCGKYCGDDDTTLDDTIRITTRFLPELVESGESVYYRLQDVSGKFTFTVDESLVSVFVYFADSNEPIASPKQTSPETITELELTEPKTIYLSVVNNNETSVSYSELNIKYEKIKVQWSYNETQHWHTGSDDFTNHDFLPFGLCECGKYIGTDIPLESKVYDLPDLAYGESVYYRMKNFVSSVYLRVDHALVNSFIYLADSVSPIASPEPGETNPTFTYLWDDEGDDAIYIVVTNYNGTTVQGAHLEVEWYNGVG